MDEKPEDLPGVTVSTGNVEVKIRFGVETRVNEQGLGEYRKIIYVNDEPPVFGNWLTWRYVFPEERT